MTWRAVSKPIGGRSRTGTERNIMPRSTSHFRAQGTALLFPFLYEV